MPNDILPPASPDAVTQAPQSKVGSDAFALPQRVGISQGLEQLGQGAEDLAVPLAKVQAANEVAANSKNIDQLTDPNYKAVQLDADGLPQVVSSASSLILGRAGEAHNEAVQQGALAEASTHIADRVTQIRQQFPTDPAGFQAAANTYAETLRQNLGATFGPQFGNLAAEHAHQLASQHFANIADTTAKLDVQQSEQAILTNIDDTTRKLQMMARGGAINGPVFDQALTQLNGYYDQLGTNKLYGYSPDKIESEKNHARALLDGEYVVGRVDETFTKQGKAEAQQILETVRNNPNLKDGQGEHLYAQGMAHLQYLDGEMKAQAAALKPRIDDTEKILDAGNPDGPTHLSQSQIDETIDAATAIGDTQSAQRIHAARIAANRTAALNGLTPDQRLQVLSDASNSGIGGPVASAANKEAFAIQYYQSKGWTHEQAVGIAANLVHESGGRLDPNAINPGDGSDGSDSIGIMQANGDRGKSLKAFAASQGKPWNDYQTQLAFVQHELETSESGAAQRLKATTNVRDATAAFALKYERPAGSQTGIAENVAGWQNRLDQANRLAAGGAAPRGIQSVGAAYTQAEAQANPFLPDAFMRQGIVSQKAETQAAKDLAVSLENRVKFSNQVTDDMAPVAAQIYQAAQRNPELAETAARVKGIMDGTAPGFQGASAPDSGAEVEAKARALAAGPSIIDQQTGQATLRGLEAGRKELTDNPAQYALDNKWISKLPAPLNLMPTTQPDGSLPPGVAPIAQQIADRVYTQSKIASFTHASATPLFQGNEPDQVKSLMTNGTIDQRLDFLNNLVNAKMPTPMLQATLRQFASAPETQALAVAGSIASEGPGGADAARRILVGQQLLQTEKRFAPDTKDLDAAFVKSIPFNDFTSPNLRNLYLESSKAYYAQLSAQADDTTQRLNQDRWDASVKAVTGGTINFRGSTVQAPWYGASEGQFYAAMQSLTPQDFQGAVTTDGSSFPPSQLQIRNIGSSGLWRLQSLGSDGKYLVFSGDTANRVVLRNQSGAPFVLDLSRFKGISENAIPRILPPPTMQPIDLDPLGLNRRLTDKPMVHQISPEMGS